MEEFAEILFRTLDKLAAATSSTGEDGAELRHKIGIMRTDFINMINAGTFADQLLALFSLAIKSNVSLHGLATVRESLFAEVPEVTVPENQISEALITSAIIFCLSTETRIVVTITFTSRDDVEKMMATYKTAFDTARELAVEDKESGAYETLTFMAGSLTQHLATVARPLPRMVRFLMSKSLPALTLSNRLYYDADRWEELIEENKTIHPAFCQRDLRGLSS